MADDVKRPIPVPRKPRTGSVPLSSQPGFSPRPDAGFGSNVRYTAPVIPSSQYTAPVTPSTQYSLGGNFGSSPYQPSYIQQTSSPLPNTTTYQPPVTPSTVFLRSNISSQPKREYSGPQRVITPQPIMNDSNDSYSFGVTPRKDSRSSSRSSLSSEPPSPLRLVSDELSAEIDRKKEIKVSLIDEVAQLTKQRDALLADIEEHKIELNELRISREDYEESLATLLSEENNVKRRLAQCEQNLQLMNRLSNTAPDEAKRRNNGLDEKEFLLNERDSRIRQKELELQSEGDILFQRRKELDLREYDMKNFDGPQKPVGHSHGGESDIVEHEERERILQQNERKLFDKESYLTDLEVTLKKERDRISKWENEVKQEDDRAQENLKRAKEMMQEVNKIKHEALNATKVAALLEEERNETHKTPSGRSPTTSESSTGITGGNTGATGGNYGGATGGVTGVNYGGVTGGNYGSNYGVTGGNYGGVTGGVTSGNYDYSSSAIQPGVSANESIDSTADDEMIARLYNMKMNAEMVQEDALFAKQMSTVHETKPADCSGFESSDAELAFQQQLEFMGIPPGSVDAEALKKQLVEQLSRQRELEQSTSRDQEIAASMRNLSDD